VLPEDVDGGVREIGVPTQGDGHARLPLHCAVGFGVVRQRLKPAVAEIKVK
jgi:hypothetical protein